MPRRGRRRRGRGAGVAARRLAGLPGFEARSSLRAWLYRVTTNVCLRLIARRPRRPLSPEHGPARRDTDDLGEPVAGPVWLEPWRDEDPAARFERRETVELAFVAALQHLPGHQRAVLILREVLGFSAAEVAAALDTTPASVNSALQRARKTVEQRVPAGSQQAELAALGDRGRRALVDAFVTAWERADVPAMLELLARDARFTMPPLPACFDGRDDVGRFFAERVFETEWRLIPMAANGQLGFACYTAEPGSGDFRLGAGIPVEYLDTPANREISRLENAIDKVVVSDTLTADQTDPWRDTTRIVRRADAHETIAELKREPGGDILVFGSRTLCDDLLAAGLVDELHLMIGAVVLGDGTPAFATPPAAPLRLLDVRTFDGSDNVLIRYAAGS